MVDVLEKTKIPVVCATVCSKCESIVGKETVNNFTPEEIEIQLAKSPENFFKYPDVSKRGNYRKVSYTHRCIQC